MTSPLIPTSKQERQQRDRDYLRLSQNHESSNTWKWILDRHILYYILMLCTFIFLLGIYLFYLYHHHPHDVCSECSDLPRESRIDCHPEGGASESSCQSRGCCWDPHTKLHTTEDRVPLDVPYCYYPIFWHIYKYKEYVKRNNDFSGNLTAVGSSYYKNDLPNIKMNAVSIDKNTLRVKIYDPENHRFEPPWPIRSDPEPFKNMVVDANYRFDVNSSQPGFQVRRTGGKNVVVFDAITPGGFIFADQFLQISTLLPSHNIYGLGEHRSNLKLSTKWQSFTLFNKDQAPVESANLYGSHPFYIVMEESGDCHGVLLLNSNAMDVILQPTPALTFRSIGGIFDFYFFMGPTPADVLRQYSEIVGKPFMPPFWSLGFHLCRYGYKSLNETMDIWSRTVKAQIPLDTQWNDLDYMDNNNDFTYNNQTYKNLPMFVDKLHELHQHYIPLIDPGVSASEPSGTYPPFDEGLRRDIFIKESSGKRPFVGKVWNRASTVWPDFTHPNATEYWHNMMENMHNQFAYDGAWIDMNEPSNFYDGEANGCKLNSLDHPPYVPNVVGNLLATKTVCMNAKHYLGRHYDVHNIYAVAEAVATNFALSKIRNKRPFIVSRASWVGLGAYAAHWTGDVFSTWHDLRVSVPEILSFSFFQIPMVGADICGFNDNTTEALCNRWMQLGAFYPFSRNHNSDDNIPQDPVSMGPLVVESSKWALNIRYKFLPYLYTLFHRARQFGDTVARPLFIEFPEDRNTWDIDSQFLWGAGFMIVPNFEAASAKNPPVKFYLPPGIWYDLDSNLVVNSTGENFSSPGHSNKIPIFLRGGFIFPTKVESVNTFLLRKNPFHLYIAPNSTGGASGELFWDDGDSLDSIQSQEYRWISFEYHDQTLFLWDVEEGQFDEQMDLQFITIMGTSKIPSQVSVNNQNWNFDYSDDPFLTIYLTPGLNLKSGFTLAWK